MSLGGLPPCLTSQPPGRTSRLLAERLRRVESPTVTRTAEKRQVFWEEASGANVRDADGNIFVDLTSGFGVALLGHGHPKVRRAIEAQSRLLIHGMGDVHPNTVRVELLERLASIGPWRTARSILASTGSEAVEIALKTAHLASGRPGILAIEGAYHGLTLGSLAVTGRQRFRTPFNQRIYGGVAFAPFPAEGSDDVGGGSPREGRPAVADALASIGSALSHGAPNGDPIGAVIVEPVQGRGGVRVPPHGFMAALSGLARKAGAVVIADEVFTGLGRCGSMLASELVGLDPDIVCLGKVLGGGMPISACIGRESVMGAWPRNDGEAIHTSTFLGHPVGCAVALAVLEELDDGRVLAEATRLGARIRSALAEAIAAGGAGALQERAGSGGDGTTRCGGVSEEPSRRGRALPEVRGLGLMVGLELGPDGAGVALAESALAEGIIVLPAGAGGEVVELTPPVCLTNEQADLACSIIGRLARTGG